MLKAETTVERDNLGEDQASTAEIFANEETEAAVASKESDEHAAQKLSGKQAGL